MNQDDSHEIYEKLKRVYEEMGWEAPFPSYEEMYGSDDYTLHRILIKIEYKKPRSLSNDKNENK